MKKLFAGIFSFLFCILASAGEKEIIAYAKNCAVTPEGALLEEVWQVIPEENVFLTKEGKTPQRKTVIKAVYEKEYLCFALKMEMPRTLMSEAMKNKKVDQITLQLNSADGGITASLRVYPLWVESSWKQDKINRSGVKQGSYYYSAEVRIPVLRENHFYGKGQKYFLSIERKSQLLSGRIEESLFQGSLLLDNLAYTDNTPRSNTKKWRNGEMNTFFKRPNRHWNSNWDLGEGDYLQQGWNLNQAKGMGRFEVYAHEDKADDYYVVLRNGDFYQMYKGPEKKMQYTFKAKGKGILKVRFLRFSFRNHALRYLGVRWEKEIHLDSAQWKTFTGTVDKQSGNENLALDFSTENGEIMLDDAFVYGIQ